MSGHYIILSDDEKVLRDGCVFKGFEKMSGRTVAMLYTGVLDWDGRPKGAAAFPQINGRASCPEPGSGRAEGGG